MENFDVEKFKRGLKLSKVQTAIKNLKFRSIPKFKEGDNVTKYTEQISKVFYNEFGIDFKLLYWYKQNVFPLSFYRVRPVDEIKNINNFDEHSYPPIEFSTLQRCNFPKYPVFYCSNNPVVALSETIKDEKTFPKQYCISKWNLKQSENKIKLHMAFFSSQERNLDFLGKQFDVEIKKIFKGISKAKSNALFEITKYLETLFVNDDDYSISASIAHNSLYPEYNFPVDIFMYPSIVSKKEDINMAVHPNFVDNQMIAEKFLIVEVLNSDFNKKYNFIIASSGEVLNDKIEWKHKIDYTKEDKEWLFSNFNINTF